MRVFDIRLDDLQVIQLGRQGTGNRRDAWNGSRREIARRPGGIVPRFRLQSVAPQKLLALGQGRG
jgi:hypothetical protein